MMPQLQAHPLRYRWRIPEIDTTARRALRETLKVSRISAQVLLNRGLTTPAQAARFLSPGADDLIDPFRFRDMRRAVERVERAIAGGEQVVIYGDYDVDGISGAALLSEFFSSLNFPVTTVVPDRFADGYGLTVTQVEKRSADGASLIITVDNGTSSHQAVTRAAALGVDVIVTDHHEVHGGLPPAYAVLNPHRPDGTYPEKRLCGVGVAFKLCHALLIARGEAEAEKVPARLLPLLDLVALGTVADVAPLAGENRWLVQQGLDLLSRESRPGIAALKEVAGLAGQDVGAGQVGFHLGPRINAGGRVAEGAQGVRLLMAQNKEAAMAAATYLDGANRERRAIEAAILEEVTERVEAGGLSARNCIVLASTEWHAGVLGIICSRMVERYHRPCVLIAVDAGGVGKGSGRSVPALNLFEALGACEDLLLGFGGHMYAAGLSIEAAQIPALAERLDAAVGSRVTPEQFQLSLKLDASAGIAEIGPVLMQEFSRIAPFGSGNPEPVLLLSGVVPHRPHEVGTGHLKMTLTQPGVPGPGLPAIAFGCADWLDTHVREGVPVDLAGNVTINKWRGAETVQFRVKDLRPTGGGIQHA